MIDDKIRSGKLWGKPLFQSPPLDLICPWHSPVTSSLHRKRLDSNRILRAGVFEIPNFMALYHQVRQAYAEQLLQAQEQVSPFTVYSSMLFSSTITIPLTFFQDSLIGPLGHDIVCWDTG